MPSLLLSFFLINLTMKTINVIGIVIIIKQLIIIVVNVIFIIYFSLPFTFYYKGNFIFITLKLIRV